jgi:hypothetical protein
MPEYINTVLNKYQHTTPAHAEHARHTWNPPIYDAKTQYIEESEGIPSLSPKYVNRLQQLCGTLLYYARALKTTLIMPVNILAQSKQEQQQKQRTKLSNC